MNLLDVAIIVVVLLAAANGFRRGAALQLSTYVGLLAGLFVGALLAPKIAGAASSPLSRAALSLVVLLGLAAVGDAIGWAIGTRVWVATRRSGLGKVDSAAVPHIEIQKPQIELTPKFPACVLIDGGVE